MNETTSNELREAFYAGLSVIQDYLPGDLEDALKEQLWERWIRTKRSSEVK